MMKRMILLAGVAFAMTTAMAQSNDYIVKTKNVKKTEAAVAITADNVAAEEAEP